MSQKSVKRNLIMNTLRNVLNIIFPIITFPYASRILLPEGIGKVSFSISLISYFIMLGSLGIPIYGIRECAKVRDNRDDLSRVSQELIAISLVSTFFSYLLLIICIISVPKLYSERGLLFLTSSTIIFATLGIDWLYQAIEEYTYITIRSIIFKIISLLGLFVFVHSKNDYIMYAGITAFSSVGSNILNIINVRKYIHFNITKKYNFRRHIKPIITLFSMNIASSIYLNLNSVMLGFISGESAVGLYSASIKITKLILTIVTSLGGVLLPRMSYYLKNNNNQEFNSLVRKSVNFIFLLSIPCMLFMYVFADSIIYVFSGNAFLGSVAAMRILLPIILFIGLSNLFGIQILIPSGISLYFVFK